MAHCTKRSCSGDCVIQLNTPRHVASFSDVKDQAELRHSSKSLKYAVDKNHAQCVNRSTQNPKMCFDREAHGQCVAHCTQLFVGMLYFVIHFQINEKRFRRGRYNGLEIRHGRLGRRLFVKIIHEPPESTYLTVQITVVLNPDPVVTKELRFPIDVLNNSENAGIFIKNPDVNKLIILHTDPRTHTDTFHYNFSSEFIKPDGSRNFYAGIRCDELPIHMILDILTTQ